MSQTQLAVLFRHLAKGESITTIEAMQMFRICRLSERIRELELRGWIIQRKREESNGKHFVRYWLKQGAESREGSTHGLRSLGHTTAAGLSTEVDITTSVVGM